MRTSDGVDGGSELYLLALQRPPIPRPYVDARILLCGRHFPIFWNIHLHITDTAEMMSHSLLLFCVICIASAVDFGIIQPTARNNCTLSACDAISSTIGPCGSSQLSNLTVIKAGTSYNATFLSGAGNLTIGYFTFSTTADNNFAYTPMTSIDVSGGNNTVTTYKFTAPSSTSITIQAIFTDTYGDQYYSCSDVQTSTLPYPHNDSLGIKTIASGVLLVLTILFAL
ncbi:hypothetical protein PROFUN_10900 [Planoprotostelium fungivorum]|uniref:Uncharacterized protein n=1 Tax=Planoprotostelium fungivorum TaxID=1890364 RepID=A0A2P6NC72_9EUKA|nr:hypothetical protein PROFUN_10900 [Planoprotostelium fungivorum]